MGSFLVDSTSLTLTELLSQDLAWVRLPPFYGRVNYSSLSPSRQKSGRRWQPAGQELQGTESKGLPTPPGGAGGRPFSVWGGESQAKPEGVRVGSESRELGSSGGSSHLHRPGNTDRGRRSSDGAQRPRAGSQDGAGPGRARAGRDGPAWGRDRVCQGGLRPPLPPGRPPGYPQLTLGARRGPPTS